MALSKDSRCPNGVIKARKVPRSATGFRPASGFVAAVDFGTTYCSVAYTLQQKSNEIHKLPIDGPHTRVPTAILIERKTNAVEAFGFRAQTKFSTMKKEVREKYIYFERMKMILYRRMVSMKERSIMASAFLHWFNGMTYIQTVKIQQSGSGVPITLMGYPS